MKTIATGVRQSVLTKKAPWHCIKTGGLTTVTTSASFLVSLMTHAAVILYNSSCLLYLLISIYLSIFLSVCLSIDLSTDRLID